MCIDTVIACDWENAFLFRPAEQPVSLVTIFSQIWEPLHGISNVQQAPIIKAQLLAVKGLVFGNVVTKIIELLNYFACKIWWLKVEVESLGLFPNRFQPTLRKLLGINGLSNGRRSLQVLFRTVFKCR